MANVEYIHPDLTAVLPKYKKIKDCIDGDICIKAHGDLYLPRPNASDASRENQARYDEYLARAVFYNVTRRTAAGLLGQVTSKPATIKVPTLLNPLVKDADGNGKSLEQLMEYAESLVIPYGRCGVFADFPDTDGKVITLKDQQDGVIRPTITVYKPESIINWKKKLINNVAVYTLIVLRETYPDPANTDEFEDKLKIQYRVLKLDNGVYRQEIWRQATGMQSGWAPEITINVIANGKPLTEIPFRFVGSEDNDAVVDNPPMYDIAELNLAHYRNSADYEESIYVVGQPTLFMTGITKDWLDVIGGTVYIGSRSGISLPVGGDAIMIQADPNTMAKEAMDDKERQMVALGARLVESTKIQRTATEAALENDTETSVLKKITNNVSAAFQWCTEWCAIFAGAMTVRSDSETDKIITQLNTDFDVTKGTPEQINAAITAWQKGAISFTEMRQALTRGGMATQTVVDAKKEIEQDQLAEAKMFKDTNDIKGIDPTTNNGFGDE